MSEITAPRATSKTGFYTYFHTRNDTGAVFYVGKGCGNRANKTARNNQHWVNIVAKHGRTVHIAAHWSTEFDAFEHEKFLIGCFRDMGVKLVNRTSGGEGPSGMIHSDVTRAKMSATHTGRPRGAVSDETKSKLRSMNIGKVHSDETRARMSASHTGRPLSEDHRTKVSAALVGHPVSDETRIRMGAWQIGRTLSPEHRAKLSAIRTGRVISEEVKAKMSLAQIGRVFSDEHRARIGEAGLGRVHSEETKEKMRRSHAERQRKIREGIPLTTERPTV